MNNDINVKALQRNCFRQSKVPGEFMLQMRVPGGVIPAKYLEVATHIAETWGDGNFHIGTRQTLDFPGICPYHCIALAVYRGLANSCGFGIEVSAV